MKKIRPRIFPTSAADRRTQSQGHRPIELETLLRHFLPSVPSLTLSIRVSTSKQYKMSLREENGSDFKKAISDVDSDEQRVNKPKHRDSTNLVATTGPDPKQQLRETIQLKGEVRLLHAQIEGNDAKMRKKRIDHLNTVVRLQEDLRKDQVLRDEVEMHRTKISPNRGDISQRDSSLRIYDNVLPNSREFPTPLPRQVAT